MDTELAEILQVLIAPFHPQQSLEDLIVEVNRLYHEFEAAGYDISHPEIRTQLTPMWQEMLGVATNRLGTQSQKVLDFGCGTGFATQQLLSAVSSESINRIICYDLSPTMIEYAQASLKTTHVPINFISDKTKLFCEPQEFNLLLTNSVLHHLPEKVQFLQQLESILSPDAVWINGHEPSKRFYINPESAVVYDSYLRYKRRQRLVPRIINRFRKKLGLEAMISDVHKRSAAYQTAVRSHEIGLFAKQPSTNSIVRLVDVWVPHTPADATRGLGFDYIEMQKQLKGKWELVWVRTYSFMGSTYEEKLPPQWKKKAQMLAQKYPLDGGNFCAVWQRTY